MRRALPLQLRAQPNITLGGASGLGKHLATVLHGEGATIIIADFNAAAGEGFAAELNATRAGCVDVKADSFAAPTFD